MTPEQLFSTARVFALPMRHEFRGVTVREGLLFEGPAGWAEFAPFHDHTDAHAGRWLEAALEQAFGTWPSLSRHEIPINAIIPLCDADTAAAWTEDALDHGCTTIKVKVGDANFDADVERIAAVRAVLDDARVAGAIRIDGNHLWSVTQAAHRIAILDAIAGGLEYVEQPVATREDMLEVRRRVQVPIAIDEGIRLDADPAAAMASIREVADVAVLKSIPLGGVQRALDLVSLCEIPVVVSGSLDTSIGIASGLWLAGALPALPYACGLGTGRLLLHDVIPNPARIVDGHLLAQRATPSDVDPCALVDAAMIERWKVRLQRAWQHARIPAAVKA